MGTTHDREIISALQEPDDYLRIGVSFGSDGGVTQFVVQYETWVAATGAFLPVMRFDTAHGRPHLDRLDREGNVVEKEWLDHLGRDQAMRYAEQYLRRFWPVLKAQF